jgi:hypothetical protein
MYKQQIDRENFCYPKTEGKSLISMKEFVTAKSDK